MSLKLDQTSTFTKITLYKCVFTKNEYLMNNSTIWNFIRSIDGPTNKWTYKCRELDIKGENEVSLKILSY